MRYIFLNILFFLNLGLYAQQDSLSFTQKDVLTLRADNPLSPAKAAFYSSVVPGMGQLYNKSYWKIPVVYAGIATSAYFYFDNQKHYNLWRNEYKRRLLGIHDTSHPDFGRLDNDRIIRGQRNFQRYRDLSLVITLGIYALNIIDANVDAHLQQFNVDDDLTFSPSLEFNPINLTYQYGFVMTYKF